MQSRHKQNTCLKAQKSDQLQTTQHPQQLTSRSNKTYCYEQMNKSIPRFQSLHIQTIRDTHQITFLQNRNQQSNKYFTAQSEQLLQQIEGEAIQMKAKTKENGDNLLNLLVEIENFSGNIDDKKQNLSGSGQFFGRELDINPSAGKESPNLIKVLKIGLVEKIEQNFNLIAGQQSFIFKNMKAQIHKLQNKFQQKQILLRKQQRYHKQLYLQLIGLSESNLQKIEGTLYELNRKTQQAMHMLEDTTSAIDSELRAIIQEQIQSKRRDTGIIEGLIQKMIYKMLYL